MNGTFDQRGFAVVTLLAMALRHRQAALKDTATSYGQRDQWQAFNQVDTAELGARHVTLSCKDARRMFGAFFCLPGKATQPTLGNRVFDGHDKLPWANHAVGAPRRHANARSCRI